MSDLTKLEALLAELHATEGEPLEEVTLAQVRKQAVAAGVSRAFLNRVVEKMVGLVGANPAVLNALALELIAVGLGDGAPVLPKVAMLLVKGLPEEVEDSP